MESTSPGTVFYVFYALHMVGILAIAHGFFSQIKKPVKGIHSTMLYGVLAQVVTGFAMAGVNQGEELNSSLISIKLSVAVVALVVAFLGRRASGNTTKYWAAVGGLTLLNIVLALVVGK
jgi:hypothetical protein